MAADAAGWCLERVDGEGAGQRLELRPGAQVTVGRGLGVTHRLLAKSCPLMISRNHCSFCLTLEGVCTVTDNQALPLADVLCCWAQSLNGVWVNGVRVEPHRPQVLCEGDLVQLGVPAEQQKGAEFVYRVVRWRVPPGRESSAKRRLGSEDSEQPGATGKFQRLGEDQQRAVWPEAASGQGQRHTARHPEPGTSQQPSCRDIRHRHRAGGLDQGPAHGDLDQGLPTEHGDPDRGLPTEQQPAHGDQDRGLPTEHRDWDQGLPTDQGPAHGDRDWGLPMEHEDRDQGLPTEHGDRDRGLLTDQGPAHGDWDRGLPTEHGDRDRGLPTDQGLALGDPDHRDLTEEDRPQVGEDVPSAESQLTEVLETELQCVICSEHFIEAVTLGCSHSFCRLCIGEWRGRSGECPICRQPIQWQTRSVVLDNCIEQMVSRLGEAVRRQREQLVRARRDVVPSASTTSTHMASLDKCCLRTEAVELEVTLGVGTLPLR